MTPCLVSTLQENTINKRRVKVASTTSNLILNRNVVFVRSRQVANIVEDRVSFQSTRQEQADGGRHQCDSEASDKCQWQHSQGESSSPWPKDYSLRMIMKHNELWFYHSLKDYLHWTLKAFVVLKWSNLLSLLQIPTCLIILDSWLTSSISQTSDHRIIPGLQFMSWSWYKQI